MKGEMCAAVKGRYAVREEGRRSCWKVRPRGMKVRMYVCAGVPECKCTYPQACYEKEVTVGQGRPACVCPMSAIRSQMGLRGGMRGCKAG